MSKEAGVIYSGEGIPIGTRTLVPESRLRILVDSAEEVRGSVIILGKPGEQVVYNVHVNNNPRTLEDEIFFAEINFGPQGYSVFWEKFARKAAIKRLVVVQ